MSKQTALLVSACILAPILAWSFLDLDATPPNTLTPAEEKDGWKLLFDGETTAGWVTSGKAAVRNGSLELTGIGIGRFPNCGSRLYRPIPFAEFDLEFDYRLNPGVFAEFRVGRSDIIFWERSKLRKGGEWQRVVHRHRRETATTIFVRKRPLLRPLSFLDSVSETRDKGDPDSVGMSFSISEPGWVLAIRSVKLRPVNSGP